MHTRHKRGYTIIEALISVAIFTLLSLAATSGIISLIKGTALYRERTVISALADQYAEFARNLPYSQIGTITGNPHGSLPDMPNAKTVTVNNTQYQIYYVVTYMDDPADGTAVAGTDVSPADYKQVKLYIKNMSTNSTTQFTTNIVPKGLEGLGSGGALSTQVFDAVGNPVPNAALNIINASTAPPINLSRTTDASGKWVEVGLPVSTNSYHIVASKSGYSTDQTYPPSVSNPNPIKADSTVATGTVTAISFSIDHTSTLTLNLVNQTCLPISGVGVEVLGSKKIGTSPDVIKFDHSYTSSGAGTVLLSSLEWDTYTPLITTSSYMVYGSSPIQQIVVSPGATQQSTFILGPSTANSLLVIVKDAGNGNPVENASVELSSSAPSYDQTKYTEGSVWDQADWSGGAGQANFTDSTRYAGDDGNVDVSTLPTGLRLLKFAGSYLPSGALTSSTFDTGTASTSYTTLTWSPSSQSASTSLAFQLAANNDSTTWNYIGPDGTASTYFTVPGTSVPSALAGNRYVRYKAYLATLSTSTTPVLSSVDLNYVSGCAAPGQAMFSGLTAGNSYQVTVSMSGYTTQVIPVQISGYNTLQVAL